MNTTIDKSKFDIDPNNLTGEAVAAPGLLAEMAEARFAARLAATNARIDLDSWCAGESLRLRSDAELTGRKTTEGAIEAAMRSSESWATLNEAKARAEANETLWGDLLRAADAKVGMVQSLIKLQTAEMRA